MSPLVSAPNRGYADYQREGNWDTGVLWNLDTGPNQVDHTSPTIDMSRSAYLGMNIAALQGQPYITIQWYLDAAATIPSGYREFVMDTNIPGNAQVRMLNLGPFVQVTLSRVTAPSYSVNIQVYGSNRPYPLEFIPRHATLVDRQNTAIAANVTDIFWPSDYYAGPMAVWVSPQFNNGFMSIQSLNTAGTWDLSDQVHMTSADQWRAIFVAPPGAWRLQVVNSTAVASSYYASVTPTTTGAT